MAGKVKPVNVSPLIKCARYGFLILGCFYGTLHLSALRVYGRKEQELRHKILHEKAEKEKLESRQRTICDLTSLAKDFEVTDLPPGWEKTV